LRYLITKFDLSGVAKAICPQEDLKQYITSTQIRLDITCCKDKNSPRGFETYKLLRGPVPHQRLQMVAIGSSRVKIATTTKELKFIVGFIG
jgi:hypothetical protein